MPTKRWSSTRWCSAPITAQPKAWQRGWRSPHTRQPEDNTNFRLGFASGVGNRVQRAMISDEHQWRRWESKTSDLAPIQATTGNHRKPDPELAETADSEKHVRESALPTGKIDRETTEGRGDVGGVPTAQTLGMLARKVLSNSRHVESRDLARAVLQLLARSSGAK